MYIIIYNTVIYVFTLINYSRIKTIKSTHVWLTKDIQRLAGGN